MNEQKEEISGKDAMKRTLDMWQERRQIITPSCEWTKKLIPNLKIWIEYRRRSVDYYLT